jgi:Domain of unknown function (DUF5047)
VRTVSAGWEPTLRGAHTALFRATVCDTFQTGTTPTGTEIPILGGAVTLDGNADARSTLDLTTDGTRTWPHFAADPLAPYGNEVYIERGVQYSDDLVEYVGLGYHRIETPDQDDVPDGPIRISGVDRMQAIIDARMLAPFQFVAGTTLGTVVDTLVTEVYPSATVEWDDTTDTNTLTRSVIVEEGRYEFLNDLVTSRGKIWYWDHRGVLVIKDLPDPTTPVFEINAGRHGVLVAMSRHLTREGVYNAVVATGEAGDTATPARGIAVDDNPDSPTYFSGRFGRVPRFYSSPLLFTDAQATSAATTILMKQLGLPYTINLGMVVNAALEPFDSVRVRYSDRDAPETHVLETLTIPLDEATAMDGTTREQTIVLIGAP